MANGPTYKGSRYVSHALSYHGLDEQLKKLEGFNDVFLAEMGAAMGTAVGIAQTHAGEDLRKKIKGVSTGELASSIYGKMLSPIKGQVMAVRGSIGTDLGLKAFAQEVGRFYGNAGAGTTHYWKGKFYLYYGARDKADAINAEYQKANERIVNRLVVKA